MTTGHVFIATSLDGFVARKDHGLDWLTKRGAEGEDHGFERFMDGVDGLVMGSGTFRTVLGFGRWPYRKPVVVLSRSLTDEDVPPRLKEAVRLSRASPRALMRELGQTGWTRAYVDGGRLVQSFLREGLIADLTITLVPVLLGEGVSLYGPLAADVELDLLGTEAFPSGLLQVRYRVR